MTSKSFIPASIVACTFFVASSVAAQDSPPPAPEATPAPTAAPSEPAKRHNVNFGLGHYIPLSASPSVLGFEANVWCLHGMWLPARGVGAALDGNSGHDIGNVHFRIHWFAIGAFYYTSSKVMVVPEAERPWDVMAFTGVEFRAWKGLAFKATLNWFLPNPYGVYQSERAKVDAQINTAITTKNPTGIGNADDEVLNRVKGYYNKAAMPTLGLSVVWEI